MQVQMETSFNWPNSALCEYLTDFQLSKYAELKQGLYLQETLDFSLYEK